MTTNMKSDWRGPVEHEGPHPDDSSEETLTLKDLIEACEAGAKEYHFCSECREVTAVMNPGLDAGYCTYCGANQLTRLDQHLAEYVGDEELAEVLKKYGVN